MRSEKVNFYTEGIRLAGVSTLPDSDQAKPYPGIVQGPGFLGLKDAKHYIMMFDKLCAAGYACLCFDYRGWGDSEGNDRGWVMPKWQAEDIRSALTFMQAARKLIQTGSPPMVPGARAVATLGTSGHRFLG